MSRTLTSALSTAIALPVTEPAYFVEIVFSTPVRLSTRGTITWSGQSWTSWDVRLAGLGQDGSSSTQTGGLTIGNTDLSISTLVLSEGVADRQVNIWKFYGDTPAISDPVAIFSGVGDEAVIDADSGVVRITLRQQSGVTLYTPRLFCTKESGFSLLPAEGTVISWGNETIRLTSEAT